MPDDRDTIAAISSAIGTAARIIVRTSGPRSLSLVKNFGIDAISAGVSHVRVNLCGIDVPASLLVFISPRSVTGEDVVEYHLPGSVVIAKMLLAELIAGGARQAEAGEFTSRGFLNGRLDLTQAEGVAATISAANERELSAARKLLAGELAKRLQPIIAMLADTLALVEVGIDFVEEDVTFLSREETRTQVDGVLADLKRLLADSPRFERMSQVPTVVLVGKPNAGKSSLLNALVGERRAVISDQAGTTRDRVEADLVLPGGTIRLVDVAGLEDSSSAEEAGDASVQIGSDMQRRSREAIESADFIVHLHAADDAAEPLVLPRPADWFVTSKRDLITADDRFPSAMSAHSERDLARAKEHLSSLITRSAATDSVALNARHVDLISKAIDALVRPAEAGELIAANLREALDRLGEVAGDVTPDDVLGRIFAGFCIGK